VAKGKEVEKGRGVPPQLQLHPSVFARQFQTLKKAGGNRERGALVLFVGKF